MSLTINIVLDGGYDLGGMETWWMLESLRKLRKVCIVRPPLKMEWVDSCSLLFMATIALEKGKTNGETWFCLLTLLRIFLGC